MPGATIGTIMNTVIAIDMTCAMRRPSVRSRTTAVAITRVAAAPTPCSARAARKSSKLGATTQSTEPSDVDAERIDQHAAAAERVRQRAVDELRSRRTARRRRRQSSWRSLSLVSAEVARPSAAAPAA